MPVFIDANPALSADWPKQLENGVLAPQVEAKDLAAQFGRSMFLERVAYRMTVRPGDQYRDSTGYRCLARALSSVADRGEGDEDAFGWDFGFDADAMLPAAGWMLLAEGHGVAYAVASWRLTIRPGWKLMLSFNTGTLNQAGGGSGWTPERQVATLTPGVLHRLRCRIKWDPENGQGALSLILDGMEIVPVDVQAHGTTQRTSSGAFVESYVLVGLYTGSDLSAPLTVYTRRFVYADTLAEVAALMDTTPPPPVEEPPPPPDPEPEPEPDYAAIVREHNEKIQELQRDIALLKAREEALSAAAASTNAQKTGTFKTFATKYAGTRPKG